MRHGVITIHGDSHVSFRIGPDSPNPKAIPETGSEPAKQGNIRGAFRRVCRVMDAKQVDTTEVIRDTDVSLIGK
jgi:hypothetical protein